MFLLLLLWYPTNGLQRNLKGQSTQVIWIENYNCNAVVMGPINQTHLKCSPKELATVVCALRTIVTTCTKNNHCHHSSHKTEPIFLYDENSRPPSCLCDEVEGHNNLDDFVSIWRSFALSNWCFKQTKAGTKLKVKKRGIQKKKCLLKSKSIINVIRRWLSRRHRQRPASRRNHCRRKN